MVLVGGRWIAGAGLIYVATWVAGLAIGFSTAGRLTDPDPGQSCNTAPATIHDPFD